MKIDKNLFLMPQKETAPFFLKKLHHEFEIEAVAILLWAALEATNKLSGHRLYRQKMEETKAFLATISELYGVYIAGNDTPIAMLAVEEDSIERIAVSPGYQQRGIATALMVFAKEKLTAEYVDVYADNQPAVHFFEHCGLSMFDETAPEPGDLMAKDPYKIIHLMS